MTQTIPLKATLLLRHKYLFYAAVLTLIGGCANREVFIARPLGLRSMVFALVLRTSTRLWVLERETKVSLSFLSVLSGERVQHAVHRVCFVGCWQACLPRCTLGVLCYFVEAL